MNPPLKGVEPQSSFGFSPIKVRIGFAQINNISTHLCSFYHLPISSLQCQKAFACMNLAIDANNPTNRSSPKLRVSTNVKPNLLTPIP